MHRCRRVGTVGMRLERATAIDENRDGTRDSNLIAREESRTNSLGPDGSVWFIEPRANRIGGRAVRRIRVPGDNPRLSGPAVASDGVVWFATLHSGSLGRQQTAGSIFSGCPEIAHDRAALQSMHRQCLV